MSAKLILLRHGQSLYNKENLFTGWTDVELSEQGRKEAKGAAELLMKQELYPDICFTSWLKRAIHTAQIVLSRMEWEQIDCIKSWQLNERHYGAWQQKNKDDAKREVGEKQFLAIRRGYDTPPPSLKENDPRLPIFEGKYRKLDPSLLPQSESLKDTRLRTLNYYYEAIAPKLAAGKTVLVSAHGNSLRSLIMGIEELTPAEVVTLEIPTGEPLIYQFDETLKVIKTPDNY
jgi:2,3-bisphosphoglycerate-dependent phosphoglycerate mutase